MATSSVRVKMFTCHLLTAVSDDLLALPNGLTAVVGSTIEETEPSVVPFPIFPGRGHSDDITV
jgi:hypothetical protein